MQLEWEKHGACIFDKPAAYIGFVAQIRLDQRSTRRSGSLSG